MRLNVEERLPWDIEADVLALPVPSGIEMPEVLAEVDRRLGGAIEAMRTLGAIKGTLWEARLIPAAQMGVRFVLAVGIGEGRKLDRLGARRLGASSSAASRAATCGAWRSTSPTAGEPPAAPPRAPSSSCSRAASSRAPQSRRPSTATRTTAAAGARRVHHRRRVRRRRGPATCGPSGARSSATAATARGGWRSVRPTTSAPRCSPTRPVRWPASSAWSYASSARRKPPQMGMGMFMAVGRGLVEPAALHRAALEPGGGTRCARPPPGHGRQGRHLRQRRHQPEAAARTWTR